MSNTSSTRGLSSKGTALTDNAPLRCQAPRSPRPPRRPVRVSLPRRRGLDPRVGDHHAWPNSSPRGVFEQLGRREMLQGTSAPSRAGRGTAVDASCIVLLAARPTRRRGLREKVRDAPREIDVEGGSQHRRGARAGGSEDAAARPRRDLTKRRARFRPKLRRDELGFSSAPAPARPRVARPRVSAAVSKKKFRARRRARRGRRVLRLRHTCGRRLCSVRRAPCLMIFPLGRVRDVDPGRQRVAVFERHRVEDAADRRHQRDQNLRGRVVADASRRDLETGAQELIHRDVAPRRGRGGF